MQDTTNNGLLSKDKQAEQRGIVLEKTLSFLLIETFTSTEILKGYLGYTTDIGCIKSLKKLEKKGYLKEYKMDTLAGRKITLWGITSQGIYAISDPEELPEKIRGFEPSRVSLLTLPHRLKCHEVTVKTLAEGYQLKNVSTVFKGFNKKPDVIIFNPEKNTTTALEIELTIKSKNRYEKIIFDYSKPLENKIIKSVLWLLPSEELCTRLQRIFDESKIVTGTKNLHKIMTIDNYLLALKKAT